jgi:hypothetical protein
MSAALAEPAVANATNTAAQRNCFMSPPRP